MIETELGFFQMQLESVFGDAIEFLQATLGVTPE